VGLNFLHPPQDYALHEQECWFLSQRVVLQLKEVQVPGMLHPNDPQAALGHLKYLQ
jgi:hypothetical protein